MPAPISTPLSSRMKIVCAAVAYVIGALAPLHMLAFLDFLRTPTGRTLPVWFVKATDADLKPAINWRPTAPHSVLVTLLKYGGCGVVSATARDRLARWPDNVATGSQAG